jgi:oligopeptide/dipeptide ABC transporter ATP-binding protein
VSGTLLEVQGLTKHFAVRLPVIQRFLMRARPVVQAVDDVSCSLREGEIFGVVGESGCGKTTLGRTILRLVEPTSGTIRFDGVDITHMKEAELRPMRRSMQIIFQDPHAALNPAMSIGQSIADPLLIHELATEVEAKQEALRVMTEVGLSPEKQLYDKYPADLSGGQKQRAVIARAVVLKPKLIVADEPVAMLDMSIRARILDLLLELKQKYRLTYLFITHDLATAKFICDRIAIMYLGRFVEVGDAKAIYEDPKHPYTQALLGAIPIPDPDRRRHKTLPAGEVPDAIFPPLGCRFHPRCPRALSTCGWEGRDFIDYLEKRRLDLSRVAEEERTLGTIDAWRAREWTAYRMVGQTDAEALVHGIRSVLTEASKPLSEAVAEVGVSGSDAVVRFRPPDHLEAKEVDGRIVECLLY